LAGILGNVPRERSAASPGGRDPLSPDRLGPLDTPARGGGGGSPGAARFSPQARASVAALIQRRIQPCADRQTDPGPGANRIRVTLNIRLSPAGALIGTPQVVRVAGVDEDNRRFEARVRDLAVAVYRQCSPFRGLPPELHSTPEGGWSNINLTYRLP
jgi:hypothetical protein